MARPKKPIERDPAPVVAARMRMQPVDQSVILAKMGDGTIVKVMSKGAASVLSVGKNADGIEVIVTKRGPMIQGRTGWVPVRLDTSIVRYDSLLDSKTSSKMKAGMAELFTFFWVQERQRRMSEIKSTGHYLVKKVDNEIFCPYAYGDETDGLWHMGDTILHKRDRELSAQEANDLAYYNDTEKFVRQQNDKMASEAEELGFKDYESSVELSPADAVTMGQAE